MTVLTLVPVRSDDGAGMALLQLVKNGEKSWTQGAGMGSKLEVPKKEDRLLRFSKFCSLDCFSTSTLLSDVFFGGALSIHVMFDLIYVVTQK